MASNESKKVPAVLLNLSLMLALALSPVAATAQDFQPSVGQAGKDVIWVPTPPELVF